MEATICKEDLVDHVFELPVSEYLLRNSISNKIAAYLNAIVAHIQIEDGLEGRLSSEHFLKIQQQGSNFNKAKALLAVIWLSKDGATLLRFLYALYAVCPFVLDEIETGLGDKVGELIVDEMTQSGQFLDRCRPLRERLNAALKDVSTNCLTLLVVGKTGIGKSSLVNSLLGKPVAKESLSTTRGTSCVKCYEEEFNGMKVQVWDTPGLWDFQIEDVHAEEFQVDRSAEYVTQMKQIKNVDLVLFCVDAAACGGFGSEDEDTIELLTCAFKKDIWSHAIIVLTKANLIRSPDENTNDEQKLASVIKEMTDQYRHMLCRYGRLSHEEAKSVPCLPAGSNRDLVLADGRPWLPEIWVTAAEKTRQGGQAVLIEWNRERVKAEGGGDDYIALKDKSKMIELSRDQVRRMARVIRNVQSSHWAKIVTTAGVTGTVIVGAMAAFPVKSTAKGRSGAKFYLSHDKKFVIKMIAGDEVALMHQVLQPYHAHVVGSDESTLLPHYVGMYRLTVEGVEHYILIMRNVLPSSLKVHKKYDLKGSTVARSASEKEKAKDLPTFKDKDFIGDGLKIKVGSVAKTKLINTLEKDVAFLTKLNIMDYSLLLGIHNCVQAQEESAEDEDEEDGESEEEEQEEEEGACSGDDGIGAEASPGAATGSGTARTPPEGEAAKKAKEAAISGLPKPFIAACAKEATKAIERGLWPVIDKSVDVFAVLSDEEAEPKIYFIGLIDVLTSYGTRKRAAHAAKTVKHGARAEISTVRPEQYARRFLEFIGRVVE